MWLLQTQLIFRTISRMLQRYFFILRVQPAKKTIFRVFIPHSLRGRTCSNEPWGMTALNIEILTACTLVTLICAPYTNIYLDSSCWYLNSVIRSNPSNPFWRIYELYVQRCSIWRLNQYQCSMSVVAWQAITTQLDEFIPQNTSPPRSTFGALAIVPNCPVSKLIPDMTSLNAKYLPCCPTDYLPWLPALIVIRNWIHKFKCFTF